MKLRSTWVIWKKRKKIGVANSR